MRKFCAAAVALMLAFGGLFAEEIKGVVFKKYDADTKLVTVEVEDKDGKKVEKKLKVAKDAVMKGRKDKDTGKEKETPVEDKSFEKVKEGSKWTVTVENEEVKSFKREGGKKGNN